jgi:hypothetical protein
MSRTDLLAAGDPARAATPFHDSPAAPAVIPAIPHAALALLPALYREAGRDRELLALLAAAPRFCLALMMQAGIVLAWAALNAGLSLGARFTWACLVLLGIAAIARSHIHGFARNPRPAPLAETAWELRGLVLYMGLAWGLGALLVLPRPVAPVPVLLFTTAPALAAAFVLRCEKTVMAFALPAAVLTAGALWWRGQPLLAFALAGVSIAGISMLHCAIRRRTLQH